MNDNRKEFVFVIGKSAGMNAEKMIEGINSVVEKQKKIKDESTYSLMLFNEDCKMSALCKSIKSMRKLTDKTYVPKGRSALYDALGYAMTNVGEALSETSEHERASLVCVIAIGGKDNASTVFEKSVIEEMVSVQKNIYKWDFVLYTDGEDRFGINKGGSVDDYEKMFKEINDYITSLR
ncbi:MAG: hypothetical protein IKU60_00345 [Clostridia bacterium]|nr:hypothetical protein [Clostridia bacterium]